MLNSLIHYELELAHMHQEQLRHRANLWNLAKGQTTPIDRGPRRPGLVRMLLGLCRDRIGRQSASQSRRPTAAVGLIIRLNGLAQHSLDLAREWRSANTLMRRTAPLATAINSADATKSDGCRRNRPQRPVQVST